MVSLRREKILPASFWRGLLVQLENISGDGWLCEPLPIKFKAMTKTNGNFVNIRKSMWVLSSLRCYVLFYLEESAKSSARSFVFLQFSSWTQLIYNLLDWLHRCYVSHPVNDHHVFLDFFFVSCVSLDPPSLPVHLTADWIPSPPLATYTSFPRDFPRLAVSPWLAPCSFSRGVPSRCSQATRRSLPPSLPLWDYLYKYILKVALPHLLVSSLCLVQLHPLLLVFDNVLFKNVSRIKKKPPRLSQPKKLKLRL